MIKWSNTLSHIHIVKWPERKKGKLKYSEVTKKKKKRNQTTQFLSSSSLKLNCKFERTLFERFKVFRGGDDDDDGTDCNNERFCC